MTKVRHILGISGGKDSAALAIYLKQKYPLLKIEYYNMIIRIYPYFSLLALSRRAGARKWVCS